MATSSAVAAIPPWYASYNRAGPLLRRGRCRSGRGKPRRATIREVLDIAIELEKRTMALYVAFVQAFPRPEEVRNFWFSMARHEAGHCGALALVEAIVESDPSPGDGGARAGSTSTRSRGLRGLLTAYLREVRGGGVSVERAFEMAIDVEASELEDVVVDMLSVVRSPRWRERAIQLLLHDLGDLSYMVERYTKNETLLARADALIERHLGGLKRRRAAVAKDRLAVSRPTGGRAEAMARCGRRRVTTARDDDAGRSSPCRRTSTRCGSCTASGPGGDGARAARESVRPAPLGARHAGAVVAARARDDGSLGRQRGAAGAREPRCSAMRVPPGSRSTRRCGCCAAGGATRPDGAVAGAPARPPTAVAAHRGLKETHDAERDDRRAGWSRAAYVETAEGPVAMVRDARTRASRC